MLGDFNIPQEGDRFFEALRQKNFVMPDAMDQLKTNFNRTKTFDKLAWVPRKSFSPTQRVNVVPFGDVVFQELEPAKRRKEISDHLPLWCEFEINKLSQELDSVIRAKTE